MAKSEEIASLSVSLALATDKFDKAITEVNKQIKISEREFKTPHSRIRLPNIRKPISATDSGATTPAITVITIGKRIFVSFETLFGS